MKKIILIWVLAMPMLTYAQKIKNLDFERRDVLDIDYYPFFESISEDNQLNSTSQTGAHSYSTLNYNRNIAGFNRVQGVINWRSVGTGNYTQFEAEHPTNTVDPTISIVNCTQSMNNLLVSGTQYTNHVINGTFVGTTKSNGILMASSNPSNFSHDMVEFNFNSLPASTPFNPSTTNHFVFITDAVRDNNGNIYAVGTVNNNSINVGHSFLVKLDPTYRIVDMRINTQVKSTFERVVYDDIEDAVYMVGKANSPTYGFYTPIIAKYSIPSASFIIRAFNLSEVFFDIKKDPASNELVVGWSDGHYHEIGLLFFDANLNLLSARTWDNNTSSFRLISSNGIDDVDVFSNKPNSVYIGDYQIFIRGAGGRRNSNQLSGLPWYANSYYHTDRFGYAPMDAKFSAGRYLEHSTSNPLFQTMNGMHPWFPKRMMNFDSELISISDHPSIGSTPTGIHRTGLEFFNNYNINPTAIGTFPSPPINLFIRETNESTEGCVTIMDNTILPPLYLDFQDITNSSFDFASYNPLNTDYTIYTGLTLNPIMPIQSSCDGPSNPNYKLASANIETIKIQSYMVMNTLGQVIARNKGDLSSNVDQFIGKIQRENALRSGIYFIEITTDKGLLRKKLMF